MKNIDRIRKMSVEELAGFLADRGAEPPVDLCTNCEYHKNAYCKRCQYTDEAKAWKDWLERS